MRGMILAVAVVVLTACGPGEEGPAGPAGPPGPQGPQGPAGAGGVRIQQMQTCSGFADLSGSGNGYNLAHERYTFSDGSALATCEVAGGVLQTSSTQFYAASQVGAAVGGCLTVFDVDTGSSGHWEFEMRGTTSTAKYVDPGSAQNGRTFSIPCTARTP